MHEELGTGPGFHYIWDKRRTLMSFGPNPWQQTQLGRARRRQLHRRRRGRGLLLFTAVSGVQGSLRRPLHRAGAGAGVAGPAVRVAEIGRPWRAINVFFNPRTSWMSREAALAPLLLRQRRAAAASAPAWRARSPAALLALAFLYCQARILQAAKGIPAWREPLTVPLMVATGLAEGAGLFWLLAPWWGQGTTILWAAFGVLLAIRFVLGVAWYARLSRQLRPRPLLAVNQAGHAFNAGSLLPMAIVLGLLVLPAAPGWALALQVLAGLLAALGGAAFKFMLITRAGFNQGFALTHLPVRGVRS